MARGTEIRSTVVCPFIYDIYVEDIPNNSRSYSYDREQEEGLTLPTKYHKSFG
jgi:hypothetical protein